MRLLDFPVPSTRIIVFRSWPIWCSYVSLLLLTGAQPACGGQASCTPTTLFSNLDGLAVAKVRRAFHDDGITYGDTCDHFGVRAAGTAQSNGAALGLIVLDEKDDLLAIVVTHSSLRNDNCGGGCCGGFFLGLGAEEGHLDAHVGKDARVQLEKGDAHFDGGFLAVGGRDDGAHAAGNLPVGIGIEDGSDGLTVLHARDVGFVDVDFDFVGVHVHNGGDAGTRETTARGNGRDHFADLGVFGDDNTGVGSADSAIVDGLLGFLDARLGADDLG